MRIAIAITLSALMLAACKEERADLPDPVEMTAEAVGYYCQMELLDHEGPKGQIHLEGTPAPVFFSQVKDAIAYLHMPEQNYAVTATYVQDMAGATSWSSPGDWIAVDKAVFVLGSDRMGGMGAPEFVPFSTESTARAFIAQHGGTLRRFDQITAADALSVAPPEPNTAPEADMAARLNALTKDAGTN